MALTIRNLGGGSGGGGGLTPEMFGCTMMEIIEYEATSTGTFSQTFYHSLGVTPKTILYISENGDAFAGGLAYALLGSPRIYPKAYAYSSGSATTEVTSTIFIDSIRTSSFRAASLYATSGNKYRFVVMA